MKKFTVALLAVLAFSAFPSLAKADHLFGPESQFVLMKGFLFEMNNASPSDVQFGNKPGELKSFNPKTVRPMYFDPSKVSMGQESDPSETGVFASQAPKMDPVFSTASDPSASSQSAARAE